MQNNNKPVAGHEPCVYEQFYGFRERPFFMEPDPDFLYLSKQHRIALDLLELAIFNKSGFCVISGDIGVGKTTLIRELLNRLDDDIRVGLITNTHPSFGELLQLITVAFGLKCNSEDNFKLHKHFTDFIIRQYADQKHTLLIIDEAQHLSIAALEELRMLSNINADKDFLLQVILVGQKTLRDNLTRPELEQFSQRLAVDYYLSNLDEKETHEYIHYRVTHAGGSPDLFGEDVCSTIYHCTQGFPRLINRICGISLVYGYSGQNQVITSELVSTVARDQHIGSIQTISDGMSQRGADAYTKVVESNTGNQAGPIDSGNATALKAAPEPPGATLNEIEKPAPTEITGPPKEGVTGYSEAAADAAADQEPADTLTETIAAAGPGRRIAPDHDSPVLPGLQTPVTGKQQDGGAAGKRHGTAWMIAGVIAVAGVAGWLVRDYQDATSAADSMTAGPSAQTAPASDESGLNPASTGAAIPARQVTERELAEQRETERLEQQLRQAEQELAKLRETERLEQQQLAELELAEQRETERLEQLRQAELELAEQHETERLEQQRLAELKLAKLRKTERLEQQRLAELKLAKLRETERLEQQHGQAERERTELRKAREQETEPENDEDQHEARRAAAKAALKKWSNAAGWSDESGDDPEKEQE